MSQRIYSLRDIGQVQNISNPNIYFSNVEKLSQIDCLRVPTVQSLHT
ncbi:hypothetical protein [Pelatocladus sp. BLCC-F211]